MPLTRRLGDALAVLGFVALAAAAAFALSSRSGAGEGFADLAAIAGAVLLTAAAAGLFGASLLAWRASRAHLRRAAVVAAALGAAFGLAGVAVLGRVAFDGRNTPLLAVLALPALLALAGLAVAPRLTRA